MADRREFDAFVAARSPALLRTAYLLVRDEGLAEDLLQAALSKAWSAWGRVDGDPERYVRRILVTTRESWWRRRRDREVPTAEPPDLPTADDAEGSTAGQDLWDALGRLPHQQRAVVVLRYYEDLTEAETARLLECSVGTVRSRCAKALARLGCVPTLATAVDKTSGS